MSKGTIGNENNVIMREYLENIVSGQNLTMIEAEQVMDMIMLGMSTPVQIGGILTSLRMKGETVEEIVGFAQSMRKHSKKIFSDINGLLDTCGTGGSGLAKFNISTTASFITASLGVPIAKHGNRQMSGKSSGSADVLQELGVNIEVTPEQAKACLEQVGICFMYAPLYHQSMKHAILPRKELGFKTIFNILGPLCNPADAKIQVIGTFSPYYLEKMALALKALGSKRVMIVHGSDGLDEITITGSTQVAELRNGKVEVYQLNPEDYGLGIYPLSDIAGGDTKQNAGMVYKVLNGEKGACRDIVLINAAANLYVAGKASSINKGVQMASNVIDKGEALATLSNLVRVSNSI